ncbi:hypothetical protein [Actinomycetospora atypica]|uniref:Transposase (putative) YhgA-like domain-containing protein n=1 Tax=Actinomycetospora atypica TaxID=1290095 RepID=A0ABV9YI31_9PSEU
MLSHLHATLTEMFRHRPAFAAEVLSDVLGIDVPRFGEARAGPTVAPSVRPTEHYADAVVLLRDGARTVGAVIVEIQLRVEEEKRWTWPLYVASTHRQWKVPTVLLVVCPSGPVARWAARGVDLGPGMALRPAVLGPDLVPVVDDLATASRSPELAVLSALAHPDDSTEATLAVLVDALATIDDDRQVEYAALVLDALPAGRRALLEDLLSSRSDVYARIHDTYLGRTLRAEGEAHGRAEGEAHGRAAILLRILDRRGLEITDQARTRITGCSDLSQLETWSDRALTATTLEDVFSPG